VNWQNWIGLVCPHFVKTGRIVLWSLVRTRMKMRQPWLREVNNGARVWRKQTKKRKKGKASLNFPYPAKKMENYHKFVNRACVNCFQTEPDLPCSRKQCSKGENRIYGVRKWKTTVEPLKTRILLNVKRRGMTYDKRGQVLIVHTSRCERR
jgi:hypothetical protein